MHRLVLPEFLRAVALSIMCEFEEILREIASEAGLEYNALHMAPVKGVSRMREKLPTYQKTEDLQYPFSSYWATYCVARILLPTAKRCGGLTMRYTTTDASTSYGLKTREHRRKLRTTST